MTYLFENTDAAGNVLQRHIMDIVELRRYLHFVKGLPKADINFAIEVTQQSPDVPYDLCDVDQNGTPLWTARITYQKQPPVRLLN